MHSVDFVGQDASFAAELADLFNGAAHLLAIAADAKEVLAHYAAGNAHNLGYFFLRLIVHEVEQQGFALFFGQRLADEIHDRIHQGVQWSIERVPVWFFFYYIVEPDAGFIGVLG
jgi:hypothetical protein